MVAELAGVSRPPSILAPSLIEMALERGTRLGPYEVTAPIGAGGMGEEYRATDTKLKCDAAVTYYRSRWLRI